MSKSAKTPFTKILTSSISYIVLSSISISTLVLVFCGVLILSPEPLTSKTDYCILSLASLLKVFLFAWPADYLMAASSNVANAAYDALWYEHGIDSQKIILYTLSRSQRPTIITVPGFIKALTFQQYTSYVSTALSFLTTFRLMLSGNSAKTD